MLGMLGDRKKMISGILSVGREKDPSSFASSAPDKADSAPEDEDVNVKDQIMATASKVIKALNASDAEGFAKAMFQMHEAIDQAIEEGIDFDGDEGAGESGSELADEPGE